MRSCIKQIKIPGNYKRLSIITAALSALVLLQGCSSVQFDPNALRQGILEAHRLNVQERQRNQQEIEFYNKQNQSYRLPMRQPTQVLQQKPISPSQSSNPSQTFLDQGMWSIPSN